MPYKRIKKTCESCGKEFMASRKDVRFCGKGCNKKGDKNPQWKGDAVSIKVLHGWVERQLGRPTFCSLCGITGKVDLANISNEYKRDLTDWEWLCRKCHMDKDGRMAVFLSHSNKYNKLPNRNCGMCGKEFHPSNKKVMFCSQSCSSRHTNLFKRDYSKRKIKLNEVPKSKELQ
jgi:hypothetical protein